MYLFDGLYNVIEVFVIGLIIVLVIFGFILDDVNCIYFIFVLILCVVWIIVFIIVL